MAIIDGYKVRMRAFCGMSYDLCETQDTEAEALAVAVRFLRRKRRQGYAFAVLTPGCEWELGEPEDCAMVPDDAGIVAIVEVVARSVACYECGSDVRIGETCDCWVTDNELDADDDDDTEDN
jgi:hypothetical protein